MNYYKTKGDKIICQLCSHYCQLKIGQVGICGVNTNEDSKLTCKVYGYPSALHVDPIEKKPLYHFLPHTHTLSFGTVGCNFKCPFCQNWQISQTHEFSKENYISPQAMVNLALHHHCESISYTYNEPTIFFPYAKDIAIEAKKVGLKNIMVSNGFMSKELCEEIPKYINAINIDIKSFDKEYYKKALKGDLDIVLANAKTLKAKGLHVEITTLMIPSIDEAQVEAIAKFISGELGSDTPWHLSAYHPDFKMLEGEKTPLEVLKNAYSIAKNYNIQNVYLGNIK
jgi:pyruvate formate lyase activating enzyme